MDATLAPSGASGPDPAPLGSVEQSLTLLSIYRENIRPRLAEAGLDGVQDFDRAADRIDAKITSQTETRAICFLGSSGVGKSTLINALVAGKDRILPQGGIGPLTALATSVRFSSERYFKVEYLPTTKLNNLIFAIESTYITELKQSGRAVPDASDDFQADEGSFWLAESLNHPEQSAPPRSADYQKQARLLIKGTQNGEIDVPYLMDCLRNACGYKRCWSRTPVAEDEARIEEIRRCLATEGVQTQLDRDHREFLAALKKHASGFLAPLVKTLEVGWEADILRDGMVLVDLPGLGVANDEYREVTLDWVRRQARAIVLVTDRSGLREAEAELLRESGFLARLLHSIDDPEADPVQLIAAVVKVDSSADDAWKDDKDNNPDDHRPWKEHFSEKCREAKSMIVPQLREEMWKLRSSMAQSIRSDFDDVLGRLLSQLEVHAVSAPQYSKLLAEDGEDRARILDLEQSNIPHLQQALLKVVHDRKTRLQTGLDSSTKEFRLRLKSTLELIKNQWSDDTRTEKEIEQLSKDLEEFLQPLRKELNTRNGEFREFLRRGIPTEIDTLIEKAAAETEKQIQEFLGTLGDAHWATLRAAVRRGGAFVGARHIDLPGQFATLFEEPVAVIWSKRILSKLRKRTSELAADYIQLVKQVATWADAQGARVQPRVVRALSEKMELDFKEIASVGKEAVDELREKVKNKLFNGIQNPIRKRCEKFVSDRRDIGPGVKKRILEFFRELVPEVVGVAKPAATSILQNNFGEVQEQISSAFKEYTDPLDVAAKIIVSSHEDRLKRANVKVRSEVLAWVSENITDLESVAI